MTPLAVFIYAIAICIAVTADQDWHGYFVGVLLVAALLADGYGRASAGP